MTAFLDGPAREDGTKHLSLRRTPFFLRVVIGPSGVDALDQMDDEPAIDEAVHVYVRVTEPSAYHVSMRPRSQSYWGQMADYRYFGPVDDGQVRETKRWQSWCVDQAARMKDQSK